MSFLKITSGLMLVGILIISGCGEKKANQDNELASGPENVTSQQIKSDSLWYFDIDTEKLAELSKGDALELVSKDSSLIFSLTVQQLRESVPGVRSITAVLGNRETASASLNLRQNKLRGTIHWYAEKRIFQIGYEEDLSVHYIQELDPDNMDVMEGSKPLPAPDGY